MSELSGAPPRKCRSEPSALNSKDHPPAQRQLVEPAQDAIISNFDHVL